MTSRLFRALADSSRQLLQVGLYAALVGGLYLLVSGLGLSRQGFAGMFAVTVALGWVAYFATSEALAIVAGRYVEVCGYSEGSATAQLNAALWGLDRLPFVMVLLALAGAASLLTLPYSSTTLAQACLHLMFQVASIHYFLRDHGFNHPTLQRRFAAYST